MEPHNSTNRGVTAATDMKDNAAYTTSSGRTITSKSTDTKPMKSYIVKEEFENDGVMVPVTPEGTHVELELSEEKEAELVAGGKVEVKADNEAA